MMLLQKPISSQRSAHKRGAAAAHQLFLSLALQVLLGTPADVPRLAAENSLPTRVSTYRKDTPIRTAA